MSRVINTITKLVTLISGIVVVLDYFVKLPLINALATELVSWIPIIASFGLVAGSVDLFANNVNNIRKRQGRWLNNLICVAFVLVTVVVGLTQGTSSKIYSYIYYKIFIVCSATLCAVPGFFLASSCYRAFRVNNTDSLILLVSTVLVILGTSSFGGMIWSKFPVISNWIMNYPCLGGQRGMLIAGGVGFVSVSVRSILGYSRITGVSN